MLRTVAPTIAICVLAACVTGPRDPVDSTSVLLAGVCLPYVKGAREEDLVRRGNFAVRKLPDIVDPVGTIYDPHMPGIFRIWLFERPQDKARHCQISTTNAIDDQAAGGIVANLPKRSGARSPLQREQTAAPGAQTWCFAGGFAVMTVATPPATEASRTFNVFPRSCAVQPS